MPDKIRIYISYSYEDIGYKELIEKYLTRLTSRNIVEIISDTRIRAGEIWSTRLRRILDDLFNQDTLYVILLSQSLISSEFFSKELELILSNNKNSRILPVLLKPCEVPIELQSFVIFPSSGMPLISNEIEKRMYELLEVIEKIADDINRSRNLQDEGTKKNETTEINLSSKGLTEIPIDIFDLNNIVSLDLQNNEISRIPKDILKLQKLKSIYLKNNLITDIPSFIFELKSLTYLDLSFNKIEKLPRELKKSNSLSELYLDNNKIKLLQPDRINFDRLKVLRLDNNPIQNIPREIFDVSNNVADSIRSYFKQIEDQGSEFSWEAKLLVVGSGGSGKTSFVRKLINSESKLPEANDTTRGIDVIHYKFPFKNYQFKANIWDFGGQAIYHSTHQFFLTERALYVLLADNRREDHDFNYWLSIIKLYSDSSPLLIVMNEKNDRRKDLDITTFTEFYSSIKGHFNTNLLTKRGLNTLTSAVQDNISSLAHVGKEVPASWIDIRKVLEADSRNFVTYDQYVEICGEYGVDIEDSMNELSRYLHNIGVILHFQNDEVLNNLVILKPNWVVNAIYKILDDVSIVDKKGRFNEEDLDRLWAPSEYPFHRRKALLHLMRKFGLSYQDGGKEEHVAIQLLPVVRPEYNWEILKQGIVKSEIRFKYQYAFMPSGIIKQLIARINKYILRLENLDLVWKSGVVLSKGNTIAEIIENQSIEDKSIFIKVAGDERKEFLFLIRETLKEIHDSFKGNLRLEEMIPCVCDDCIQSNSPFFHSLTTIHKFKAKNRTHIQCNLSASDVEIINLVDGFESSVFSLSKKRVFISYAHEDKDHVEELNKFFKPLKRSNKIEAWYDGEIVPGNIWAKEIFDNLNTSDLVILVISQDFVDSDYCYKEMETAFQRQEKGLCEIIPVIVRPADWKKERYATLQVLPDGEKPVVNWDISDEAYLNISLGIQKALNF